MKFSHLVFAFVLAADFCVLGSFAENADAAFHDEDGGDTTHASETPATEMSSLEKKDSNSTLAETSTHESDDSHQGYRMPGLFGLSGGEPFYLEKDPVTGAVDFNTKTIPVKRKEDNIDTDEYFYEDEENTGDGIDRRDGGFMETGVGRPNHFSPYVNDVNARIVNHKYDTNNKFPLISSSYANTKIQGTGAESHKYNHKPYVTSSTQPPSYYTIRPPHPTYVNPPRTSTSTTRPSLDSKEHSKVAGTGTTSLNSPVSSDVYRTKPEDNPPLQPNLRKQTGNKETEYSNPTTPHSKPLDVDDYYEDEYDADSGSEFKLSDLFGYGQASDNAKLEHQENVQHGNKHGHIPLAGSESTNQNKAVVQNDRTERVPENVYIVTSTEKSVQYNERYSTQIPQQETQENYQSEVQTQVINETRSSIQPVSTQQAQEQYIRQQAEAEKHADSNQNSRPVAAVVPTSTSSTTPFIGIIYSESEKPKVATSMPLGIHFQYTTQKPLFGLETPARRIVQHHSSQQFVSQPSKSDNRNNSYYKLAAQAEIQSSKPVNVTPSTQLSSAVTQNPYGLYAEEPFRPIFGPGNLVIKEAELLRPQQQPLIAPPAAQNTNTIKTVGQESSVVPVRQQLPSKIPEESPTRWHYPYREGSSQYFQLQQGPPRLPGVQPPSLDNKPATFAQDVSGLQEHRANPQIQVVSSSSIVGTSKQTLSQQSTTLKPSAAHQNLVSYSNYENKVNAGLDVASGDNLDETSKITLESGIQFSSENEFVNDKTKLQQQPHFGHSSEDPENFRVPPLPDQRRPPSQVRPSALPPKPNTLPYVIEEPAQDLRPPANPENSLAGSQNFLRPHWESRPSGPQKLVPPNPQNARPKQDTAPTYFGQLPGHIGHRPRPGAVPPSTMLQGNRMHMKNNPNQESRLPNILPQFRPNAKISHGHSDTDGRIQADAYFAQPPRQSFHERPARRPQAALTDHLQPPPPTNYRRVNRNEVPVASKDGLDVEDMFQFEKDPPPPPPAVVQQKPLVHRRTGPHLSNTGNERSPVATLQMMQQHQHLLMGNKHHLGRPLAARDDFPDKYNSDESLKLPFHVTYPVGSNLNAEASEKRPVFVVYPVSSGSSSSDSVTADNTAIVMGTRGSNWPVPPSNLAASDDTEAETYSLDENPLALPFIGHKDQKPLLQLPSDRLDPPVLKTQTHVTGTKPIKTDFPYPLEPPSPIENEKYEIDRKDSTDTNETHFSSNNAFNLDGENSHKEAFSLFDIPAEVHNSHIDRNEDNDDDSEINIIPYLQDYMPFATKKPITNSKPVQATTPASTNSIAEDSASHPEKLWSPPTYEPHRSSSPISVTLKTVQPIKTTTTATTEHSKSPTPWMSTKKEQQKISDSEFTVSAVMHTHQSNHRPTVEESTTSPPQLNFQAPFLASENIASVPTFKGWSVVSSASPAGEEPKQAVDKEEQLEVTKFKGEQEGSDPSNFDFENFRPQLFGGFKPIYSFPPKDVDERPKFTTEREEKMI